MPGAVTCGTCDPLQIPGSPILEELTKLKRKKIPPHTEVNGWPGLLPSISGQIYIHTSSFDTCGF